MPKLRTITGRLPLGLTICGLLACGLSGTGGRADDGQTLEPAQLGATRNVHACGSTLLCGQPTREDLATAQQRGIQVVITLRTADELDWNEQAAVEQLGLEFVGIPFQGPETLTDDVFEQARRTLRDANMMNKPVMLHCASANRVGAIWMVYRVLDERISIEQAAKEAKQVGLRTNALGDLARAYIDQQQQQQKQLGQRRPSSGE